MTDPFVPTPDQHRALGIAAFNATWDLLVRDDRADDEHEAMLRSAYTSAYHWTRAAGRGPENEVRALYLQAKVWLAVGNADAAMRYAERCMTTTNAAAMADFDLAYAHEIVARALHAQGRVVEAEAAIAAARAVPVDDPEDRAIVESDLATFP